MPRRTAVLAHRLLVTSALALLTGVVVDAGERAIAPRGVASAVVVPPAPARPAPLPAVAQVAAAKPVFDKSTFDGWLAAFRYDAHEAGVTNATLDRELLSPSSVTPSSSFSSAMMLSSVRVSSSAL